MIGKERLFELVDEIIRAFESDGIEIVINTENSHLTRYANSMIHQNMAFEGVEISVRSRFGKKAGVARTNRIDREGLIRVVRESEAIARQMIEDPELPDLKEPEDVPEYPVKTYYPETAEYPPAGRAEGVRQVIDVLSPSGFNAYGAFATGDVEIVLANSAGLKLYYLATKADLTVTAFGKAGGTGWAQASSMDVRDIKPAVIAERAAQKVQFSENPAEIEPGYYPVIFEPLAASELFGFMNYVGFSAKMVQEGRSFLKDKLGKKVFDEKLTILDDPFDERGFPYIFDMEGVPRRKIVLVENGVVKNFAYDRKTAAKEGKVSTGNAGSPFSSWPVPLNTVVREGNTSLDEMIKRTERGILVTMLHYVNIVDPMTLTLTGMTRGGTFLIEGGKISKGLKNLRFTQSVPESLSEIEAIGNVAETISETSWYGMRYLSGIVVPAIKVKKFKFTGKTDF